MTEAEIQSNKKADRVKKKAEYDAIYRDKKRAQIAETKQRCYFRRKDYYDGKNLARYFANHESEKEHRRQHYAKNREERSRIAKQKYAANPDKIKAAVNAYRLANKEAVATRKLAYSRTTAGRLCDLNKLHKRRVAIKSTRRPITTRELVAIRKTAKGRCYYCRESKPLTFDHVIPLSKGGIHSRDNIVCACGACNSSKGAKDPIEFAKTAGMLLI